MREWEWGGTYLECCLEAGGVGKDLLLAGALALVHVVLGLPRADDLFAIGAAAVPIVVDADLVLLLLLDALCKLGAAGRAVCETVEDREV